MTAEPRWRRDPEAKKLAILRVARFLFNENGYDATTVRDIANGAEVNASLVYRYFGSKEELFARAVPRQEFIGELFAEGWEAGVNGMIDSFLPGVGEGRPFIAALLRDARDGGTGAAARLNTLDEISKRLAEGFVGTDDIDMKAELLLAWVIGIGVLHDVVQREPVASADPDRVTRLVMEAIDRWRAAKTATPKRDARVRENP